MSSDQFRIGGADDPIPPLAKQLQALVEMLYPEPGVVDILTLDQFEFRYKLSGLGATAVADMERAQRITRSVGDRRQIGLAEFHIGLIYLHWKQYLGAIKYFDDAKQHWRIVHDKRAVSLAQFAQGVCQHHACHYEVALASYGKTQRFLSGIDATSSPSSADFLAVMGVLLRACHEDAVHKIVGLDNGDSPPSGGGDRPPSTNHEDDAAVDEETAVSDEETRPPISDAHSRFAPPISNLPPTGDAETKPDQAVAHNEGETAVLPSPASSPIPMHENSQSDRFIWYDVVDREELEDFLPDIQMQSSLLVDTRTDLYTCKEGDVVIVDQADVDGSILVEPQQNGNPSRKRVCLAEVDADEIFTFQRDLETGEIKFTNHSEEAGKVKITAGQTDFPIYAYEIIGVVIGIWSKLKPVKA